MVSTRPAWQLLSARPAPRLLSRRLIDPKFLPRPIPYKSAPGQLWASNKASKDDGPEREADEDLIKQLFEKRANNAEGDDENIDLEDLIDEKFHVNVFEQDHSGRIKKGFLKGSGPDEEEAELDEILGDDEDEQNLALDLQRSQQMTQEEFERFFPSEELKHSLDEDADPLKDFDLTQYHIATTESLPVQAMVSLEKLNGALDEAKLRPRNDKARKAVWMWYTRCKREVPSFLSMIPITAWELLWASQAIDTIKNAARLDHLRVLAQDKADAGWTPSQGELMVKIESLYVDGRKEEALNEWRHLDNGDLSVDAGFLQLGARMFALDRQYNMAEIMIRRTFDADDQASPRLILTLIRALCGSEHANDVKRAFAWYEELRTRLGQDMVISDYDKVILAFLGAGHSRHALAVFRDMMLTGREDVAWKQSTADPSWQRLTGNLPLYKNVKDANEINKVALQTMQMLPPRFRNKFFFGSWIKKLIGENEVSAAAQVIELMYESGIRPDAKYLNGLIGAWLRQDNIESHARAENLAWLMIRRRLTAAAARDRTARASPTAKLLDPSTSQGIRSAPVFIERSLPEGNIETWSLIADYYLHHSTVDKIRHLRDLMSDARIPMNAVFMNILLGAELRANGYRRAWARFEVMTRKTKPSLDSYIFLWDCLKHHLDTAKNPSFEGFPMPRELFKLTMDWFNSLPDRQKARELGGFDVQGYHTILRGFSYNRDINGLFAAMQTLHAFWGAVPDDKIADLIVTRIARLEVPQYKGVRAGYMKRLAKSKAAEYNVEKAAQLLGAVRESRNKQYAAAGVDLAEIGEEAAAIENHRVILAFLHVVLKQREGAHSILTAAKEMGVEEFDPDEAIGLLV